MRYGSGSGFKSGTLTFPKSDVPVSDETRYYWYQYKKIILEIGRVSNLEVLDADLLLIQWILIPLPKMFCFSSYLHGFFHYVIFITYG
jgi:hypothetical protein